MRVLCSNQSLRDKSKKRMAEEGQGQRSTFATPCSARTEAREHHPSAGGGGEAESRSPMQVDCERGAHPRTCTYCDAPNPAGGDWGSQRKGKSKVRGVKFADVDK